jgi:tail lysozyme
LSDILREYLIRLGYKIDDASYKKFKSAVAASAKEVAGLGSVTVATATAIGISVEKVAREFEGLYYASQRTGETVNRLKSYGFAAKQIGIAYDQSASALDSFTTAQRLNPGIKGFVGLGGGTGTGPVEQMTNFVEHQKKLYGESGYYVAAMNAELAGIPEATFLQIWNNLPKLRAANAEMNRMRQEAGLSGRKFTDDSVAFTNAWDHLLGSLDLGKERIASDLIGPTMRGVQVIDEIVQAFNRADVATNGWAGAIVGVTSAIGGTTAALALLLRMLGLGGLAGAAASGAGGVLARLLGFAANPYVAGAAAVYYGGGFDGATAGKEDDEPLSKEYRAKHGGSGSSAGGSQDKLRDATIAYFQSQGWSRAAATGIAANISAESKFDPAAVGDNGSAYGLGQWHKDRQDAFKAWSGKDIRSSSLEEQLAFIQHELTQGADQGARRAGQKLRGTSDPYDAGVIFSGLYERPGDVYGQAHARGKQAANWYDVPLTPGAGGANMTVNQKTDIHVAGSDPKATGDAVAGAQDRVNGDLVRNFQGSTR